ncbi:hypothetical protein BKG60_05165 [Mycobacterium syngnathidarum]|uniref:ESX-1 secretion-associated protein EspA/EspE-like domain-containing protein n=1 Tax=Mycobacterium syngnathidarum TaxID=1908205 RepID=A0A1S1K901_9MYCO|nr:hypothetical protein [Mycobacterium sp. CnD-18-1]MCG7608828.1 hypothetical protein [Mycobacterium sp. CnD-18-1]OHU01477.1 hypothetical protein BKG61_08120 [Mycobacterium syngnathidarum]OLT97464.1 hypothetical protein BKG60_05165 [Mycobacterium syngnathidarum]
MSPASGSSGGLPTRSQIENWSTSHLTEAAATWRQAATRSENTFEEHLQNIASPGGTTWDGDAKDAALDRVTADVAVVGRQGGVLREAADLADNGDHDINAAIDKAAEAITTAENNGFSVAENLKVTDARKYDITTIVGRNRALAEHAEDIRWSAEQLVSTAALVGKRLHAKAVELEEIRFDGDSKNHLVQAVDYKLGPPRLGDLPETPGQDGWDNLSPFGVPRQPKDSIEGGGRWEIDYDHPYQGNGLPPGPPQVKPWHRDFPSPVIGPPSGFKNVVEPPPNGWGATPGWNLQEAYTFRVVGEGFDGAAGHAQWVQRDGNWYPATWVGYQFEAEHKYVLIPQNDGAGLMRPFWGAGVWAPIEPRDIGRVWATNPSLHLYIPNPYGGNHEFPGDSTNMRGS